MKALNRQLYLLDREEAKYIQKKRNALFKRQIDPLVDKIEGKIPEGLAQTLENLFEKAFYVVFEKGSSLIEKTYRKDDIEVQHLADDFVFEVSKTRASAKKIAKNAEKSNREGRRIAFVEGGALGLIGIGLPDIPIFIAVILRGLYKIALSYGFDYRSYPEKIYMLKLIQVALASEEETPALNADLDALGRDIQKDQWSGSLEAEISATAKLLSDRLLLAKFIQGLPLIGASGSVFNYLSYNKISKLALIKYKKRYFENKK